MGHGCLWEQGESLGPERWLQHPGNGRKRHFRALKASKAQWIFGSQAPGHWWEPSNWICPGICVQLQPDPLQVLPFGGTQPWVDPPAPPELPRSPNPGSTFNPPGWRDPMSSFQPGWSPLHLKGRTSSDLLEFGIPFSPRFPRQRLCVDEGRRVWEPSDPSLLQAWMDLDAPITPGASELPHGSGCPTGWRWQTGNCGGKNTDLPRLRQRRPGSAVGTAWSSSRPTRSLPPLQRILRERGIDPAPLGTWAEPCRGGRVGRSRISAGSWGCSWKEAGNSCGPRSRRGRARRGWLSTRGGPAAGQVRGLSFGGLTQQGGG
ncbi:uncharacterized protein LOC120325296 [Pipra filicauda]|uniref:Uncharacterized protein LOC120325296 n=1 Tax=Pipra filicauda TaxID=649802 RepID=A0A7R5L8J3_9PASS|nr:uncharacterized protein LOC120325296 [Pipra filicauda]